MGSPLSIPNQPGVQRSTVASFGLTLAHGPGGEPGGGTPRLQAPRFRTTGGRTPAPLKDYAYGDGEAGLAGRHDAFAVVTDRRAVLADLLIREAELVDLSAALDEPATRESDFKLATLALAQRARTWFRGFIALQDSPVPAAGLALLRLAAEVNILIRFLELDPALHTELWQAEGERLSLATIEEHNAKHAERWGAVPTDDAELDARRSTVREAHAKAVAAGIISERSTSVLPSTARQVKAIHHRAAYEAYTLVYRPMGFEIHSSAPSLLNGEFETRNDGSISFSADRTAEQMVGARAEGRDIRPARAVRIRRRRRRTDEGPPGVRAASG